MFEYTSQDALQQSLVGVEARLGACMEYANLCNGLLSNLFKYLNYIIVLAVFIGLLINQLIHVSSTVLPLSCSGHVKGYVLYAIVFGQELIQIRSSLRVLFKQQ